MRPILLLLFSILISSSVLSQNDFHSLVSPSYQDSSTCYLDIEVIRFDGCCTQLWNYMRIKIKDECSFVTFYDGDYSPESEMFFLLVDRNMLQDIIDFESSCAANKNKEEVYFIKFDDGLRDKRYGVSKYNHEILNNWFTELEQTKKAL